MGLQSEFAKSRHWNYRVVRQTVDGETQYGVHEVYYRDSGVGWTAEPVAPVADSVEELRDVLRKIAVAPELDVIDDPDPPELDPLRGAGDDRLSAARDHVLYAHALDWGGPSECCGRAARAVLAGLDRHQDAGDELAAAVKEMLTGPLPDPEQWWQSLAPLVQRWEATRAGQGLAQPDQQQQDGAGRG